MWFNGEYFVNTQPKLHIQLFLLILFIGFSAPSAAESNENLSIITEREFELSEAFVIGTDNALHSRASGETWHGLGGWVSEIEVAYNPDGSFHVFARGSDNGVYHRSYDKQNDSWSEWHGLGGWASAGEVAIGNENDVSAA